jgi:predicted GIY-YIG superfamily endonuclease
LTRASIHPAHGRVLFRVYPGKPSQRHALYRRHQRSDSSRVRTSHGAVDGFTKTYGVKRLVYFEEFGDIGLAIQREKTMKHWWRDWKISLIESRNPEWRDLFDDLCR